MHDLVAMAILLTRFNHTTNVVTNIDVYLQLRTRLTLRLRKQKRGNY